MPASGPGKLQGAGAYSHVACRQVRADVYVESDGRRRMRVLVTVFGGRGPHGPPGFILRRSHPWARIPRSAGRLLRCSGHRRR